MAAPLELDDFQEVPVRAHHDAPVGESRQIGRFDRAAQDLLVIADDGFAALVIHGEMQARQLENACDERFQAGPIDAFLQVDFFDHGV